MDRGSDVSRGATASGAAAGGGAEGWVVDRSAMAGIAGLSGGGGIDGAIVMSGGGGGSEVGDK